MSAGWSSAANGNDRYLSSCCAMRSLSSSFSRRRDESIIARCCGLGVGSPERRFAPWALASPWAFKAVPNRRPVPLSSMSLPMASHHRWPPRVWAGLRNMQPVLLDLLLSTNLWGSPCTRRQTLVSDGELEDLDHLNKKSLRPPPSLLLWLINQSPPPATYPQQRYGFNKGLREING